MKIYEIHIPYNFPTTFYECDGELINICDPIRPEPKEIHGSWNPEEGYVSGGKKHNTKLLIPVIRVKKEHVDLYIKMELPALIKYGDTQQTIGNYFIFKKDAGEDILIGLAIRDAFGGTLTDKYDNVLLLM